MAAQTKEAKATTTEVVEEKALNPLEAPEARDLVPPTDTTTWQYAFWSVADELDATGNHWMGSIFRELSQGLPVKAAAKK